LNKLSALTSKISPDEADTIFTITRTWFHDDDKALHKRIGALIVKIFVDIEKDKFERRLADFIPLLIKHLDKENFDEVRFKCSIVYLAFFFIFEKKTKFDTVCCRQMHCLNRRHFTTSTW
jgi:hypothetical protein